LGLSKTQTNAEKRRSDFGMTYTLLRLLVLIGVRADEYPQER
jgi:hypothetical protein